MYQRKNQVQELEICLIDCIGVMISFLVGGLIRFGSIAAFNHATDVQMATICVLLVHIVVFYVMRTYEGIFTRGIWREFIRVFKYNILLLLGVTALSFAVRNSMEFSRGTIFYFIILNQFVIFALHRVIHAGGKHLHLRGVGSRVLVICSRADALQVIQQLSHPLEGSYVVTALALLDEKDLSADRAASSEAIEGVPVVAGREDVMDYAVKGIVDEVFLYIGSGEMSNPYYKHLILELEKLGIVVNVNVPMLDLGNEGVKRVYRLGGFYVIAFTTRLYDYRLMLVKRVMDIAGSLVGLVITGIVMIFLAPAIKIESPGPLFFKQTRVGKNGRPFTMYKFRSMYADAEERKKELMAYNEMQGNMFKMTNDPRVTKVGRFIRKTSLDELPQFWNVFKGEMSLVGTRPPTMEEYLEYQGWQKRRISFKPGITGLWQISGRSNIHDFDEVVKMDLEYIDNWSLGLDVKIILKTVVTVLCGVGAK